MPADTFGTGWCGERSWIKIVASFAGKKSTCVQKKAFYVLFAGFGRHIFEHGIQCGVTLAEFDKNAHHRQRTFRVGMDKMDFERKGFAVSRVFAWCVEVKLLELEAAAAILKRASFFDVHLNGVAVVPNAQGAWEVLETELVTFSWSGVSKIDGRLVGAALAQTVGFVQVSPRFWPFFSRVTPGGIV